MYKTLLLFTLICTLPLTQLIAQGDEEYGKASFYSDDFQGGTTAYGDTYDKNEMTCSHKRHPYGTRLRVTRLDNGKSVQVKVIDKGPYIKGRVVDLSRRAAEQLGMDVNSERNDRDEEIEVKVSVVGRSSSQAPSTPREELVETTPAPPAERPESYDTPAATPANTSPAVAERSTPPASEEQEEEPQPTSKPAEAEEKAAPQETQESVAKANDRFSLVGDDYSPYGLYRIVLEKPNSAKFGVQVASLSNYQNVLKQVAQLQAKWFDDILISIEPGANNTPTYKIILGPFDTQKEAQHYQESLQSRYNMKGFVVDLEAIEY